MELRGYFFTNMYMSSIQNGIQSAHTLGGMFEKYAYDSSAATKTLWEWNREHKTMVVLGGGNSADLNNIENAFCPLDNEYPWCSFREDEDSLNNALTCVGIVLPDFIYETAKRFYQLEETERDEIVENHSIYFDKGVDDTPFYYNLSKTELWLVQYLSTFRLAV